MAEKTNNGRTKGIKIDGAKLRAIINGRDDMTISEVGTDLGFSCNYLVNMLDRNSINAGMIKYLEKMYDIPFEAYEYKEPEPEPEPEVTKEDLDLSLKISDDLEPMVKALCLYFGTDGKDRFDYERLWKVIRSAVYEGMDAALNGKDIL